MATKKQRRRRAKDKRHEWETVYVDDEGNEVEVDEPAPSRREARADRKPATKGSQRSGGRGRGGRTPEPPSWRRSAKRTLIVAPIFFAFLLVVEKELPTAFVVAALYSTLFVPFSYGIDMLSYRMQMRRAMRDR